MKSKKDEKGGLAGMIIGGMTMVGLAVGFFLLQYSGLYFVASIVAGVGIGLLLAAVFVKK